MFGYITPLKPELRVREFDTYRAVYCGLCRGLSHTWGPLARFTLSYDFTFAAMLHASLSEQEPVVAPRRCPFNPMVKRPHLEPCESVSFACDTAMLLLYGKVRDNVADASALGSLPWRLALPFAQRAANKAGQRRPQALATTEHLIARQAECELGTPSLDAACDPTAQALGSLFSLMSPRPDLARILDRLGYMLGRYVYLCDAIDDLPRDLASGEFNPLRDRPHTDLTGVMRATIAEAGAAYALLEPHYFKEILDNILYLGLSDRAERLIAGRKEHERSL